LTANRRFAVLLKRFEDALSAAGFLATGGQIIGASIVAAQAAQP